MFSQIRSRMTWLLPSAAAGFYLASSTGVAHSSEEMQPLHFPWSHKPFYAAYDTASLRRGYEVYRQVCATCHSMDFRAYRELVGVSHTESQAKALAASFQVKDAEPDETGEYFERPGRLSDHFPSPYVNDEQARFANNGALPPDLSLIVRGRMRGEDYVYSLITGYKDAPHGLALRSGLYYNPYFAGGSIGMAPPLTSDGQVEYEDATPATISQMAKDVASFLKWSSDMEQDERKLLGMKFMGTIITTIIFASYWKRLRWNLYKTRRLYWVNSPAQRKPLPKGDHWHH